MSTEMHLPDNFDLVACLVPGGVLWQALLAAGWLAPCEGRVVKDGEATGEQEYISFQIKPSENGARRRFRLILLDPLPEEAKSDAIPPSV